MCKNSNWMLDEFDFTEHQAEANQLVTKNITNICVIKDLTEYHSSGVTKIHPLYKIK